MRPLLLSHKSECTGLRRETIVRLENGRHNPSLRLAVDIAEVFGVTAEEIFRFRKE